MVNEIQTSLLAMTPVGELRLSIPVALSVFRLHWLTAYFVSVIGNLIPVFFLLLFLEPASNFLSEHFVSFKKFFSWLFARTRRKYNKRMKRYGYPALILFVATPLPVTGGWTGALIAFLFGIPFKKSFPLISLGVLIAGGVVTGLTRAGITIEEYFGYQTLIGIILTGFLVWILYNKVKVNYD